MKSINMLEAMTNIDGDLIENARPKGKRSGRTVTRMILLAALIAALTFSVLAADSISNWFVAYFSRHSAADLTQNQIAFIEGNTTQITQSQTCNGYTISVESAFSDGSESFVKLKLIAPEDVKLDARNFFPGNELCFVPVGTGDNTNYGGGWICYVDDATPNEAEITGYIHEVIGDRTNWILRIEDIYGIYEENVGQENYRQWTELLAEGIWEFQIEFSDAGFQEIELINEPIQGEVNVGLNKDSYHAVTITSFKLRAMSAEITYKYVESVHGAGDFDPIYVVMKDGSEIMLLPESGSVTHSTYTFAAPVILSDADYVRMPDGTKLPIQ